MDILTAIKNRHSVRSYIDKPLDEKVIQTLNEEINSCNNNNNLNIQLITNEPQAFNSFMAKYGKFKNVKNYIALIGEKSPDLDEKLGYYGEQIAIKAQQLGLNTCWVALSFSKRKVKSIIKNNEKLLCVLALGYGENQGVPHKSKPLENLFISSINTPQWFKNGMELVLLAPTAVNQQKFLITLLENNIVKAESTGGFYSKIDLGIVKYHFEVGAGKNNFKWR